MNPEDLEPTVNTSDGISTMLNFHTCEISTNETLTYAIQPASLTNLTIRFKTQTETNMSMDPQTMQFTYNFNGTVLSVTDGSSFSVSLTGLITDTGMSSIPMTISVCGTSHEFSISDRTVIEYEINISSAGYKFYKDGMLEYTSETPVTIPSDPTLTISTTFTEGKQFLGFLTMWNDYKHTEPLYAVLNPPYEYQSTSNATDTESGAVRVIGGVGITEDLQVGETTVTKNLECIEGIITDTLNATSIICGTITVNTLEVEVTGAEEFLEPTEGTKSYFIYFRRYLDGV
jgi:hypothetical protein